MLIHEQWLIGWPTYQEFGKDKTGKIDDKVYLDGVLRESRDLC